MRVFFVFFHSPFSRPRSNPWPTNLTFLLINPTGEPVSLLTAKTDSQGAKTAQKRERNAKDAKGAAKSQLKVNQKALNIQCETCKATFLSTTREAA